MELILGLFHEKRRVCPRQGAVIRAVVLALFLSGACHDLSARAVGQSGVRTMDAAGCAASVTPGAAALWPDIGGIREELLKERERAEDADTFAAVQDMAGGAAGTADMSEAAKPAAATAVTEPAAASGTDEPEDSSAGKSRAAYGKAKAAEEDRPAFAERKGNKASFTEERKAPALPPAERAESGALDRITEILEVPEPAAGREISGFVCDDRGHITGYRDSAKFLKDSLAVLPRDGACTGVTKGAFKGLENKIAEIFVTENITYIEEGTFDCLINLVFIEADPKNTAFYSSDGILYRKDGSVFARPRRLM